jgi:FemAB-related protein (PEP-CTERM system-associated)
MTPTTSRAGSILGAADIDVRGDVPSHESDRYVDLHPSASGYHRRAWTDLIGRAFGHRTLYLTARTPTGVAGVLPLVFFRSRLFGSFTVSLPFVNYGGVLADGPEVAAALLDRAVEETRAAGGTHLELRHTAQLYSTLTPKRHKVAMVLPLADSAEREWERLDRKVRNQVRKGEKSDLSIASGGAELLGDFYQVFAHNMRDLGTPVYGRSFFDEVLRSLPESSRTFVVHHQGRPVAASLVCWYRGAVEVPWASALRSANPLSANVYLYWQMLKFAVDRGFQTFDFGRSTPNEGTFQFKKQWGGEPRELVWEYWTRPGAPVPHLDPKNPKFDMAIRMWRRLPVAVASAVGPHVVRNIP